MLLWGVSQEGDFLLWPPVGLQSKHLEEMGDTESGSEDKDGPWSWS